MLAQDLIIPSGAEAVAAAGDDRLPKALRPWRLIRAAVLWLAAANAGAFAAAVVGGFGVGLISGLGGHRLDPAWYRQPTVALAFGLLSAAALQALMLFAALRRGHLIGRGDCAAGLGNVTMRRPYAVAGLAALMLAFVLGLAAVALHAPAAHGILRGATPRLLRSYPALPVSILLLRIVLVAGLAPVAEELFFRGWLWTGLRRSWSPAATMLVTGLLWLVVHIDVSLYRPLALIPLAIVLSVARQIGGSVRASLAVHAANNTLAAAMISLPNLLA